MNKTYLESLYALLDALGGEKEKDAIDTAIKKSRDFLEDLQVEYTRLFINGIPHVVAPPYGSVYFDKSLQGKYAEQVMHYYCSKGYALTDKADFPDNLIHQLEFLSFLAEDKDQESENEFLGTYFLPWFETFSKLVKKEAQHPFYRIIITLIDFFTKEEKEYGVQLNEA
ncbi:chaperone TorD [Desulfomarina profundi]|uniref:Chaperone TorD n=1 Tax=Desulfomarina profundi TaxID=2772557 RepID=A0A8D5FKJ7_9BACT|nr:molecular chaperone TorD family protein [Desulfomarina profundi]BCL60713.1 chaperone TorD [Desulfomarina profundi]